MKKVLVNGLHNFEIEFVGDTLVIDGIPLKPDLRDISENHYHLLVNHKGYRIEVVEKDEQMKSALIIVNDQVFRVNLMNEKGRLLENLGFETNPTSTVKDLKAPMPGLVLDILVRVGQRVEKADELLILEAMKMENLIKSPSDLIVKSVEVKKGDKIEKNQTLLYFE